MTDTFSNPADGDDIEPSAADPDVLSALVARAAGGDRDAAGEYFAHTLPALTITSKRIAGTSHDADDLLGEALLVVLAKWSEGTGPTDNVPAYIAQTMRNRIRDDFRSPRSKVAALDVVEEPASRADPRIRELEIESELAVVRRALGELPEDQQRVLVATVLEGMKPRDLEEHLARPAAAIYSLSRRARGNLRRTTLRLLLEENARPECVAAAQLLPETVGDTPEDTKANRSTEHYRTCPYCRRSWRRFAGLATLGVLPIAGAVALAGPAGSAEASEIPADAPTDGPADVSGNAPSDAPADVSGSVPTDASASTGTSSGSGASHVHEWARTAAMVVAAGTALVLMTAITVTFVTKTWIFAEVPLSTLNVVATSPEPDRSDFDVAFAVDAESWTVSSLSIELSADVVSVTAPDGWDCAIDGQVISCTTTAFAPTGGVFEIEHSASGDRVDYDVEIEAIAQGGATVRNTYTEHVQR